MKKKKRWSSNQLAYELAQKSELVYIEHKLLGEVGQENAILGNYDLGIQQMKDAVRYLQSVDGGKRSKPEWSGIASSIGRYYGIQRKDTAALAYYDQMLARYIHEKDTLRIHNAFNLLHAFNRFETRNADENKILMDCFMELTYFRPGDTTGEHAFVLSKIAESFVGMKNYGKGLEYYQAAISLNPKGDFGTWISTKLAMRNIYVTFRDFNKALQIDRDIATELQKRPTVSWNSWLYFNSNNLAQDYTELHQYDQALVYLNTFLQAAPYYSRVMILNMFTRVYFLRHRYDEALRIGKKVMDEKDKNDFHKYLNLSYTGMIIRDAPDEVLQKHGILPAERYNLAIKNLQLALDYFKQRKSRDEMQDCYRELSITFEKVKDYKGFYDTYKPFIVLRDSSVDRDSQISFLGKLAQIEHEKKEDSLRYQQLLTEERLQQQTLLSTQQQQSLLLNQQKFTLLGKEKDFQQLNNQKTQSDLLAEQNRRQANEKQLSLSQKEQALSQTTVRLQTAEIKGKQAQSRYLLAGIAALLALSFFIARNYYNQRKSNRVISAEKQRSDNLLLNILPADVAEELKEKAALVPASV